MSDRPSTTASAVSLRRNALGLTGALGAGVVGRRNLGQSTALYSPYCNVVVVNIFIRNKYHVNYKTIN